MFKPKTDPVFDGNPNFLVVRLSNLRRFKQSFLLNLPWTLKWTRLENPLNRLLVKSINLRVSPIQRTQKINCSLLQFKASCTFQLHIRDRVVIPQLLLDVELIIISEKSQNRPTSIHFQLVNQNPLKDLKPLKVNSFQCGHFIEFIALGNQDLFERRNMISLQIPVKNNLLKIFQLIIR